MEWVRGLRSRLKGHPRPVAPVLLVGCLVGLLSACGGAQPDRTQEIQRQQRARQQERLARCDQQRNTLSPLVKSFQQRRAQLLAINAEAYVPSPGPRPLDPDEQRRLAIYDQEIEQEQYQQALAAWEAREAERFTAWRNEHAARREEAATALASAAQRLRAIAPGVVSGSRPPALQRGALQRLLSCQPQPERLP
jgi:hypothetical protein